MIWRRGTDLENGSVRVTCQRGKGNVDDVTSQWGLNYRLNREIRDGKCRGLIWLVYDLFDLNNVNVHLANGL